MANTPQDRRRAQFLSTARANPGFALRVVNELPAAARQSFVAELARPEPRALARRPGLAKCVRSPYSEANGFAVQLAVFARGARR